MDPKHTEAVVLGGGAVLAVAAIIIGTRSSSSSGGYATSGPSNAAVQSITSAQAADQAAFYNAGAARSQAAASTLVGLAGLAAGQNTTAITTGAQTSQAGILAQANEVIQQLVSGQANYATQVAGQTTVSTTNTLANASIVNTASNNSASVLNTNSQSQAVVAASAAASQAAIQQAQIAANAAVQQSNNAADVAKTQSNNSLWSSLIGGIASVVPFFSGANAGALTPATSPQLNPSSYLTQTPLTAQPPSITSVFPKVA